MAEITAAAAAKHAQPEANLKETIESILVAFILAFVFRAFVVEAFVIPTGSMAPTLYGAHMRFRCPDCGYNFDVGYRSPRSEESEDIDIDSNADRPGGIHCPNCGYDFPSGTAGAKISEPVRFGDRILVLKYLYLVQPPVRWDVVVFKSPSEPHHVPTDPEYGQNYIKRLIGKPNETILILDGDIYVGPPGAKGVEAGINSLHVAPDARDFMIQRKPRYVQDALWRGVYDNDFIPQNQVVRTATWHQPWQTADGSGWTLTRGEAPSRVFQFNNPSAGGSIFFNSNANYTLFPLTDWLAYDQLEDGRRDRPGVSDLKLTCFYTRQSGEGALRMYLTKLNKCFVAEVTPGKISLYQSTLTKPLPESSEGFDAGPLELIESRNIPQLAAGAPAQIDLINCDYRVNLRVNGVDAVKPYEYSPNVADLWQQALDGAHYSTARPQVRISADHQVCTIEHLSIWRDIYYGNRGEIHDSQGNDRGSFWGSPENVVHLGPTEYFVLGDNSHISGDARYWGDPIRLPKEGIDFVEAGRVPEQFMLGKAFFVYWPAGYHVASLPINAAPDFGEMRFIR